MFLHDPAYRSKALDCLLAIAERKGPKDERIGILLLVEQIGTVIAASTPPSPGPPNTFSGAHLHTCPCGHTHIAHSLYICKLASISVIIASFSKHYHPPGYRQGLF